MRKPKIGTDVYTIYEWSIERQKVYALGEESFISDNFCKATYKDSQEWQYCHYGITWFYSMDKAKSYLKKQYKLEWPSSKNVRFIGNGEYCELIGD